MDRFDEMAFRVGMQVVNEWHRRVGIEDVLRTKLCTALADQIATEVLSSALRDTWNEALEAAISTADEQWHVVSKTDIRALKVQP